MSSGSDLAFPAPPDSAHAAELEAREPRSFGAGSLSRLLLSTPFWAWDAALLVAAGALANVTSAEHAADPVLWSSLFGVLVLGLLSSRGFYRPRLGVRLLDTARVIVVSTAVATAVVISVGVFAGESSAVGAHGVRLWLLAVGLLIAGRSVLAFVESSAARGAATGAPTLIVGAGNIGHVVARRLQANPRLGLRPVGFLDKEPRDSVKGPSADIPVLGASWDLPHVVAEHGIRHVIVTFSTAPAHVLLQLLNRCEQLGVRTSFVPRLFEKTTEQFTVDRLGGVPLLSYYAPNPRGWQFGVKYAADRVTAAIVIGLASPVLGALALAVLVTSGRPILYRQERVGRDGKRFGMLKFRSMRSSPEGGNASLSLAPDTAPGGVEGVDRRTPLGTFMRRTSLDELPQLFNVLNGDMSFVGPRPERPEFVDMFEGTIHRYGDRHRVKSGITGWAQVNGLRGKTSITDRAEWDNYYIENWSLWFDFKILLQTALAVARPGNVE